MVSAAELFNIPIMAAYSALQFISESITFIRVENSTRESEITLQYSS